MIKIHKKDQSARFPIVKYTKYPLVVTATNIKKRVKIHSVELRMLDPEQLQKIV